MLSRPRRRERGRDVVGQQDQGRRVHPADAPAMEIVRTQTDACGPEQLAGTNHQGPRAGRDLQFRGAGSHFPARLHPDTPTVFVVIAGDVRFTVEGQQPVTATRGSIVNIMKTTIFSYDVAGNQNALWVEVNPTNYKTAYPASGPQPAATSGGQIVKVSFDHTPGDLYAGQSAPLESVRRWIRQVRASRSEGAGRSPLREPADRLRQSRRQQVSRRPRQRRRRSSARHVQSQFDVRPHARGAGGVVDRAGRRHQRSSSKTMGEFHAIEGDVLYAAPMMWHQMGAEAPSGPSVRLAMGGYPLINMNNTEGR